MTDEEQCPCVQIMKPGAAGPAHHVLVPRQFGWDAWADPTCAVCGGSGCTRKPSGAAPAGKGPPVPSAPECPHCHDPVLARHLAFYAGGTVTWHSACYQESRTRAWSPSPASVDQATLAAACEKLMRESVTLVIQPMAVEFNGQRWPVAALTPRGGGKTPTLPAIDMSAINEAISLAIMGPPDIDLSPLRDLATAVAWGVALGAALDRWRAWHPKARASWDTVDSEDGVRDVQIVLWIEGVDWLHDPFVSYGSGSAYVEFARIMANAEMLAAHVLAGMHGRPASDAAEVEARRKRRVAIEGLPRGRDTK